MTEKQPRSARPSEGNAPGVNDGAPALTGPAQAFVGVGSNLDPSENVFRALALLEGAPGITVVGISTFYRTPALPAPDAPATPAQADPDYLNGVVELRTTLEATALASALMGVEAALGRVRTGNRFQPRTMDLDLLLYSAFPPTGAGESPPPASARPPHPEIRSRPFVAIPLLELAPDLLLPPDGTPLREIAASFSGPGGEAEGSFTERLRVRFLRS